MFYFQLQSNLFKSSCKNSKIIATCAYCIPYVNHVAINRFVVQISKIFFFKNILLKNFTIKVFIEFVFNINHEFQAFKRNFLMK